MPVRFHLIALIKDYPPATGGIQTFVKELYEGLPEQEFMITLLIDKANKDKIVNLSRKNINAVPVTLLKPFTRRYGWRFVKYRIQGGRLKRIIRSVLIPGAVNILHTHWNPEGLYGGMLAKETGITSVWTCNNLLAVSKVEEMCRKHKFWKKFTANETMGYTQIVAVSRSIADRFMQHLNVKKENISVIYNSIHTGNVVFRNGDGKNGEIINLLYAGRIIPHKKVIDIIDAFKILNEKDPRFKLVIAGEGGERSALMDYARQQNLEDKITFPGHVNDTRALYKDADFYISASTAEGLPHSPLEAMLAGVYPVLSDIGPHEEILNGCEFGRLFRTGSAADLAETILSVNLSDLEKFRPAISEHIRNKFSREKMVATYCELFARLERHI